MSYFEHVYESDGGDGGVDTLDDHALLDLIEHGLAVLGARPLGGTVDDSEFACRVQRLHRVETIAAAEKLRWIAELDARQTLASRRRPLHR